MWRIILILAVLPMVAAAVASWWFGTRVMALHGGRLCRLNGSALARALGTGALEGGEVTALEAAREIHLRGLAQWKSEDSRAASAREGAKRFGIAVPPLAVLVMALGMLARRIPALGAIAGVLGMTALACFVGWASIGVELRMSMIWMRRVRDAGVLPSFDDERAVSACLSAVIWEKSLPPVMRWVMSK